MAKKEPSAKQLAARQKFAEQARARAAAAKAKKENKPEKQKNIFPGENGPDTPQVTISQEDLQGLLAKVEELKNTSFEDRLIKALEKVAGGPQIGNKGVIGTIEKYNVDPANYPDPRERLSKEKKLERFAFDHNYELGYEVQISSYETKDGLNMKEPKFILELIRIMLDDETGEPTNKRFVVCRLVFHEDPQTALVVARENGLEVPEQTEKNFLDEMRYLRMRDWLLEAFYPPRRTDIKNKREMVVGNKLVEVYEINSENSAKIPWDQIKKARL